MWNWRPVAATIWPSVLAGSPVYIAMPIHYSRWKFHEHRIHACKWNIFMRMATAKLISEHILGWKTVIWCIARISLIVAVQTSWKSTIAQFVFRILTRWNSLFRYDNCHEWLRSYMKIHFSISSNNESNGRKLTRFSLKSGRMWKFSKIPLESHKISEGGSQSILMGSYIWVLWKCVSKFCYLGFWVTH